jgi:NitT/TauT family transport system substrate-binding protein
MRLLSIVALLLVACAAPSAPTTPAKPTAGASVAATVAPAKPAPTTAPAPTAPPAPATVRLAHVPSTLFGPLYVAIEKGYLQEQAITAQLEVVTAGQDAVVLAAQGQLDAVVGGFSAATFNAIDRGLDVRVVGSMGAQPETGYPSAIMVRKDLLDSGQVRTLGDLRGRKTALAGGAGSTGSYWMATKLREGNLTLRDVEVVSLAFPEMVAAMQSAAIDVALPPAPFTTEMQRAGTAEVFGGGIRPGASAVGTLYSVNFMRDQDAAAKRFMTGLVRGARDLQGDRFYDEENLRIFSQYTRQPVEALQAIDRYGFHPDLRPDAETLMDMQRVFFDAGILVFNPPLTADRVVDDTYSRAAVAALGSSRP